MRTTVHFNDGRLTRMGELSCRKTLIPIGGTNQFSRTARWRVDKIESVQTPSAQGKTPGELRQDGQASPSAPASRMPSEMCAQDRRTVRYEPCRARLRSYILRQQRPAGISTSGRPANSRSLRRGLRSTKLAGTTSTSCSSNTCFAR